MKKVVAGLVGIVLSFAAGGCQQTIDKEAQMIKYYSSEIRRVLKVAPGETCQVVNLEAKKGEPFSVIIRGEKEDRFITFYDKNKDGEYDLRERTIAHHEFDVLGIIPAEPNQPENKLKKYQPEKQENLKKKEKNRLLVYDL